MGLILSMIASYNYGVSVVSKGKRGVAAGMITTFRNTGTSLGVAILGSLFLRMQFNKFSYLLEKNKETANLNSNIFEGWGILDVPNFLFFITFFIKNFFENIFFTKKI